MTRNIDTAVAKVLGGEVKGSIVNWGGSIEHLPLFSSYEEHWYRVESWMVKTFSVQRKVDYAAYVQGKLGSSTNHLLGVFNMLTAPLDIRCLAFLVAMGVDVSGIKDGGQ